MNRYDNVSCFNAGAFPLRITGNDTSSYRCLKVGSESSRLHGRTVESRRTNFSRPEFWHVAPVICQIGGRTDALDDVTYENVIDVSEEEDSSLIKQKTKKESQRTLDMLLEIDSVSKEAFVTPLGEFPPVDKDELTPFCLSAVRAADKRKGIDPVALRISPWTFIASFLIIVSGKSEPQVRAITNSIEEDLQKQYNRVPRQISGKPASGWVLLDCTLEAPKTLHTLSIKSVQSLTLPRYESFVLS